MSSSGSGLVCVCVNIPVLLMERLLQKERLLEKARAHRTAQGCGKVLLLQTSFIFILRIAGAPTS